jgi:DNA-binding NarL/FixJ family response regulator
MIALPCSPIRGVGGFVPRSGEQGGSSAKSGEGQFAAGRGNQLSVRRRSDEHNFGRLRDHSARSRGAVPGSLAFERLALRALMSSRLSPGLRILLLEDDPVDAEVLVQAVEDSAAGSLVRTAGDEAEFVRLLDEFAPQVILSNHGVADLGARDALELTQARAPESPFILVAGEFDEEASECLRAGAAHFILKSDLTRLRPAIETALELRSPLRRLSARQRQVLQMLAAGSSTREIARQMGVSIKTVEAHRAQIMLRTGIREVAGLVRYSAQVGLVSVDQKSEPRP